MSLYNGSNIVHDGQEVAEAKRKEEEGRQRIVRRDQFLTELNQKFNGKKLAAIKLTEHSDLLVEFEGGEVLEVAIQDQSDNWYSVYLVINNIDTDGFRVVSSHPY